MWTAAVALQIVQHEVGRFGHFLFFSDLPMQPARYVERHGVVLIVALSESMLALGLGVGDQVVTPSIVVAGLLTLTLAAAMWALYFVDTDEDTRRALEAAASDRVVLVAGRAFVYSFVPILAGILMISTGLSELLEHPLAPLSMAGAAFLAGGAVVYTLGVTAVRQLVVAPFDDIAALATAVVCGVAWWIGPHRRLVEMPCSPSRSSRSRRSRTASGGDPDAAGPASRRHCGRGPCHPLRRGLVRARYGRLGMGARLAR